MLVDNKLIILKIKIEKVREELHLLWAHKLKNDTEVLAVSIHLDSLLNKYQSLQKQAICRDISKSTIDN
jgi:hypothetical protein